MQDFAVVPQAQTVFKSGLGNTGPDDIALSHVPDTFRAVDQMVNLALKNRFKVRLHLASGHFHPDCQRYRGAFRNLINVRADDLDIAVVDLVKPD